jgi:hypothetical protein
MAIVDESDPYIKRWLTGLSPKTKRNYPCMLTDWFTFIGLTPTETIQKRLENLASTDLTVKCFFEDKWKAYKEALEATGTNSDSKVHDRLKVVASFFHRNNLPLSLAVGDWKSTQKQGVKEKKWQPDLNDIKRMYGHADLNRKCTLLILAQSGFSEIDIAELRVEDIQGLYSLPVNEHYVIEKPREKTGHLQATCLSYEFLHDLKDLLAERGNPTTGYIFTSQTKAKDVEHIDARRINESMQELAEKTFGNEKVQGTDKLKKDEFQTKMLRGFYNSALLRANIQPQELKDLMFGHDVGGARSHYPHDDTTIREAYVKAFEYLSINGIQSREDLAKIKADMNALIGSQQVQIEQQNKRIAELKQLLIDNNIQFQKTVMSLTDTVNKVLASPTVKAELKKQKQTEQNQKEEVPFS